MGPGRHFPLSCLLICFPPPYFFHLSCIVIISSLRVLPITTINNTATIIYNSLSHIIISLPPWWYSGGWPSSLPHLGLGLWGCGDWGYGEEERVAMFPQCVSRYRDKGLRCLSISHVILFLFLFFSLEFNRTWLDLHAQPFSDRTKVMKCDLT